MRRLSVVYVLLLLLPCLIARAQWHPDFDNHVKAKLTKLHLSKAQEAKIMPMVEQTGKDLQAICTNENVKEDKPKKSSVGKLNPKQKAAVKARLQKLNRSILPLLTPKQRKMYDGGGVTDWDNWRK